MSKVIESISKFQIGNEEYNIDAVMVGGRTLPSQSQLMPAVSSTDNGKTLMVSNGQWGLISSADLYSNVNGIPCGDAHNYALDYLTFDILESGTIGWKNNGTGYDRTIQYSLNGGTWTTLNTGTTISVSLGDNVRFKGTNTTYAGSKENYSGFGDIGTSSYNVSGNIMSLIYGDNFVGQTTLTGSYNFCCLWDHGKVVSAENLILPAITLTPHCYRTLLGNNVLLTKAPALPALNLAESCYWYMFGGDVLLERAPDLPATTLVANCYHNTFTGCTRLNYIRCLATNPSNASCTSWVSNVAGSGTFVKDINTQWVLNSSNGVPPGWTVVDEGTLVVSNPVISCTDNFISFSCITPNVTFYYKLNNTGSYMIYDNPVEIYDDTFVEVYAEKNGVISGTVSTTCTYVEPVIPDDGDSESEEQEHNYALDYLTLDIITGGNLLWKSNGSGATKAIEYSINDGTWTSITSNNTGVTIPVSAGDSVRLRGTNSRYCEANKSNYSGFDAGSATFNISGNIMSLIYGDGFVGKTTLPSNFNFTQFFKLSKPVSAENMILPATSVPESGYRAMFSKCTTLTVAPQLPATTLGTQCYYYMFEDCAITTAPDLPAQTLVSQCYASMFQGCSNLNYIKCLATNPTTAICQNWTSGVASVGIFIKDENVTWSRGASGIPTNWNINDDVPEEEQYDGPYPALLEWYYNGSEVTLPYSVNAINGHTSSYSKGTYAFTSKIALDTVQPTYLYFDHADQSADIYIDNTKVMTHWGGYNSFVADITNYVHTGLNFLTVGLNNTTRNTLAPAAGDFNYNATLGTVRLLTSPVLPGTQYGYDGFHVSANVTSASASLTITTSVNTTATVVLTIDDGTYHYTDTETGNGTITFNVTITNPHLWNGTLDPHLYDITLDFYYNNTLCQSFTRPYGLRYFSYVYNDTTILQNNDPYTGFLLNGQPYLLRGVCMHQDLEGKANALTLTDINNDFAIIQELGCNFIRTAHYPHPKAFYDKCDELGIIVQTEVPCVNKFQSTMPVDYYTHLEGQYTDMVNEHYNHPSIIFWGLGNEITTDDTSFSRTKLNDFRTLIRTLDPSRWVGYVVSHSYPNGIGAMGNPTMDWIGQNLYVGWYLDKTSNNPTSRLNTCLNNAYNNSTPMGFSEYGCGGNILCHSDNPLSTTTTGNNPRHDIEFQMWLHEGHIAAIKNKPELLFSAQWVLFDFAVSSRNEGYITCLDGETEGTDDTNRYLNDKGLVKRDHVTKKDTFYLYKAWWNPTSKFVHICGKNYQKLTDRELKCYTNDGNTLDLYVNDTFIETVTVTDNIATFTTRTFSSGDVIRVEGATTTDTTTMTWV